MLEIEFSTPMSTPKRVSVERRSIGNRRRPGGNWHAKALPWLMKICKGEWPWELTRLTILHSLVANHGRRGKPPTAAPDIKFATSTGRPPPEQQSTSLFEKALIMEVWHEIQGKCVNQSWFSFEQDQDRKWRFSSHFWQEQIASLFQVPRTPSALRPSYDERKKTAIVIILRKCAVTWNDMKKFGDTGKRLRSREERVHCRDTRCRQEIIIIIIIIISTIIFLFRITDIHTRIIAREKGKGLHKPDHLARRELLHHKNEVLLAHSSG